MADEEIAHTNGYHDHEDEGDHQSPDGEEQPALEETEHIQGKMLNGEDESPTKEVPSRDRSISPSPVQETSARRTPIGGSNNLSLGYEHFPSMEDGRRSSRSSRSGRLSPTHSAHGSLMRYSLMYSSEEKRARKVRFYRNGDRFYKGMVYAVSPERFRTFESLLVDLTSSPVCQKDVLPNGVRHLFSIDGSKKITSLDQLDEGESYVCASIDTFKRIDYSRNTNPASWNPNSKKQPDDSFQSQAMGNDDSENKEFIRPKLVTVIRNGTKPRKAVRVLLNRKTAHSLHQVLTDITNAIKLDSGAVRKLFTLDGRQVLGLADFFKEDSIFLAYGPERQSADDFDLDDREVRFVSAYQSVRDRKRVTLKSPKLPRRPFTPSNHSVNGGSQKFKFHSSPAGSPSLSRKTNKF